MSETCKARVWDSGDKTDCGEEVYHDGLCRYHWTSRILSKLETIKKDINKLREYVLELETGIED